MCKHRQRGWIYKQSVLRTIRRLSLSQFEPSAIACGTAQRSNLSARGLGVKHLKTWFQVPLYWTLNKIKVVVAISCNRVHISNTGKRKLVREIGNFEIPGVKLQWKQVHGKQLLVRESRGFWEIEGSRNRSSTIYYTCLELHSRVLKYSRSSRSGHSRKRTALLTCFYRRRESSPETSGFSNILTARKLLYFESELHLRPLWLNPVWTLAHTVYVYSVFP